MEKIKVGDRVQISIRTPREDNREKRGVVTRIIDGYQCKIEMENGEATWEHIEHLILLRFKTPGERAAKKKEREFSTAEDNAHFIRIYTKAYREGLEHGFTMARRIYQEEDQ